MEDNMNGGPAFPRTGVGNAGTSYDVPAQDGMTLLDYFAAKAMAGIIFTTPGFDGSDAEVTAKNAYYIAEAMLAERKKRIGGTK